MSRSRTGSSRRQLAVSQGFALQRSRGASPTRSALWSFQRQSARPSRPASRFPAPIRPTTWTPRCSQRPGPGSVRSTPTGSRAGTAPSRRALAAPLGPAVRLETPVEAVEWDESSARIHAGGLELEAAAAVVAAPAKAVVRIALRSATPGSEGARPGRRSVRAGCEAPCCPSRAGSAERGSRRAEPLLVLHPAPARREPGRLRRLVRRHRSRPRASRRRRTGPRPGWRRCVTCARSLTSISTASC